ncbi:FAD-binding protein [Gilvibacter sediminis]|uniref:FAD-binding protein n=1 Tax=Gilvibacter sediminis TaxID=379071 RepID=UPI00235075C2|nr:FAD-binding protein [Gilvibacter sediminis]MDC7998296.1 FAD-linked oxidase [Gilvibacter sediminis]
MASTIAHAKSEWDTLHHNGPFPLKTLYITELEGEGNLPDKFARYTDAAHEIQRLIQETKDAHQGFRAYGSRWSMNHIASHHDRMHYNGFMNMHIPTFATDMNANSNYHTDNVFFFQCGNTIKRVSEVLSAHGKSLKTSGASNGQTIAGCISTGVHGSGLDVGSVQDYVVGLNIITGPNPQDIVYLEPASKPALNDTFAQKIAGRIIRDDEIFKAALVSLGSFGFIHGVVIEAEDRFLLNRYVQKIPKKLALELSTTMDFANSSFKIPQEVDANGKPNRPYHYKVFINPYSKETDYVVEVMYKKPYQTPYPDPFPIIKESIYRDLIYVFIKIAEKFPKSIPWLIKRLRKTILPLNDLERVVTGTLPEIFWDAPYQGAAFACSFGVDHKDSAKALQVLTDLTVNEGPIPGIFAMRFVKQSEATMAFTKFPITCMLEIDGVLWKPNRRIMSLNQYGKRMIEELKKHNIPFTIHWGKNADWDHPGLVEHMFNPASIKSWQKSRAALLSPEMQELFSNHFLSDIKLKNQVTSPVIEPNDPIT